jgi:glycosyltransferase involved in cell wall biosynthesis
MECVLTKIVHLTSVHPPFDVRIFYKECVSLAEAGYEVVVIAQCEGDAFAKGVTIRAIPKAGSQVARMTRTVVLVLRKAIAEDGRIYHFHDPELIPVGIILKLLGKRVVYDVHENVPEDILTKDYIPSWWRRWVAGIADLVERLGAKCFDGVVAVTPNICLRFPQVKTVLIRNFPVVEELMRLSCGPYRDRPKLLIYAGRISVERGITEMVEAMGLLPEHPGAKLLLAGVFTPKGLSDHVFRMKGAERIDFRGLLPRGGLLNLFAEARIGLAMFHPGPNQSDCYPNKLFEYMAAGIPVVASNFPMWREIVEETGCGLLVDPLDPEAIAEAIAWLLEHPEEAAAMGRNGMQAVSTDFNWAQEAKKLCQFYQRLLGA